MVDNIVLSLFCGIDGLGIGFEREGYCVVRGPEKVMGGDVREFHAVEGMCEGVIAGPPCQGFSRLNRNAAPHNYSHEMVEETIRIICEAKPKWALIENVIGVPDIIIKGYERQRFNLDYAWFSPYARLRVFQFYSREGVVLNPMQGKRFEGATRGALTCCEDIGAELMRDIQGFPRSHKLPHWTNAGKKRAYGNAVPIPMAHYLASLIRSAAPARNVSSRPTRNVSDLRSKTLAAIEQKRCECGCGRVLMGRQRRYSSGACRLRGFKERQRLST